VAVDDANVVSEWQPRSGRLVAQLPTPASLAWFSADSRLLVTGFSNSISAGTSSDVLAALVARVWNARTGRLVSTLSGHGPVGVNMVTFSPDSSLVVTAGTDKSARVWEARTGRLLLTLAAQPAAVTDARISPDGTHILTWGSDQTTRIYPCDICASGDQLLRLAATRTGRQLTALERTQYMYPLQAQ
jgi:WD40 repeat protein